MKRFYPVFLLFFAMLWSSGLLAQPEITPSLQEVILEKSADEFISVNIRLSAQYDEALLYENSRNIKYPSARRSYVVNELKNFSAIQQASLLLLLEALESEGRVKHIQPLWIGNLVNVMVLPEVIEALSTRNDLARLDYNKMQQVIETDFSEKDQHAAPPDKLSTHPNIAWNVSLINAPGVWSEGFTGEEVVVSVIDSGVNYNHQDLAGRMWTHPNYPNHGFNFVNNSHNTMDDNSHGTHCAGTVAGNGTAGTLTGIAPQATIMALKVLDGSGSGTEAGVWAAIQFSVEYGASVMSFSLGWKHAWNPDRSMWRTTMNNALAAGVIAAVAAGNEGTSYTDTPPSQVRTPGDIPPPWTNPTQMAPGGNSAVVSVGSTTNTDAISSFSSKGPVTWQNVAPFNDYPYNPGTGLIRPDVVAPGSNIISLSNTSNTGYTTKSGTSMATPAVAGLMALMVSKNPGITPEQISQILEETAISQALGKNNTFGSGRVNALAAVNATPYMGIRYVSHAIDDSLGNDNGMVNPGETISLSLVLENPTEEDIEGVQTRIFLDSEYAMLTDSVAVLGNFLAGESRTFENIFAFQTLEEMPGKHLLTFRLEAFQEDEANIWKSRFEETGVAPRLQVAGLIIDDQQQGNGNGHLDPGETAILQFKIENTGQLPSEEINITVSPDDPLIVFSQAQLVVPPLVQDGHFYANFEISVHGSMAPGITAMISLDLHSGPYQIQKDFYLKIGLIMEDWESGNFEQYEWQFDGSAPWVLVSDQTYEGTYAAKSGTIGHSASSGLFLTMDVVANDTISFYRKVSSENNYDWLEFYIDGVRQDRWSGERNWEKVSYPVLAGNRTFRWAYVKDYSVSSGQDAAWIDNIEMPATILTLAFAGFDSEQCGSSPIYLEGYASQYEELEWTSSGDGVFENATEMNTIYTPGNQDILNKEVTLTLKAFREDEVKAEHSRKVTMLPQPEVDLGEDFTLCVDHVTLLNAGPGYSGYLWSNGHDRQNLWVINNEFGPQTAIWVEVTNQYGCAARDTVVVTFDACLDVSLPQDNLNEMTIYPNPASGSVNMAFFNNGAGEVIIRISDQKGQIMHTSRLQELSGNVSHELDISGLKAGLYFLIVETAEGRLVKRLTVY
ncbi:MAG: S8 family peptidase [Bacteroidales bacterium]|nr:S8 family peptidase [Bacteroidales bacterium]